MRSKNFIKSVSIVIVLIFLISFWLPAAQTTLGCRPGAVCRPASTSRCSRRGADFGLKTASPIVPDGSLSPAEALAQQAEIDLAQRNLVASLPAARLTVMAQFQYIPYLALKVDQIALQDLISSPLVSSISEDRADTADMASATAITGANQTWASGYDGTGIVVAVLDTGVQWDHPFLGGSGASRLVAEACYSNAGGAGGNVSLCPDGSSAQITGHAADPTTANCLNGLTNLCTHGTHVAGTVAGNGQNGVVAPFSGVAPNASLIAVQVFTRFNTVSASCGTPPCILSYASDQIKGLEYVYSLRNTYTIALVNMGLGGGSNATACDVIEAARKAAIDNLLMVGIATAISSGNSSSSTNIGAPGCISTAVTIGATNDNDIVTQFSNSNSLVDLLAPGVSIDSSIPSSTYANFDGTSMAAPHVSGAWAF